ncbi:conjugal transfer protein TraG [Vallitalea longa]|uniref:Conjugal transfer protein TraG n=1 Tax=Vallitalea longa TaxID=2936439 RepID=A0A9W6DIW7_9FIRM|nr:type IV secretory system conjugative DNA transfer family protein [Vallitalea longa]GKX32329.1 conjugal transfer protein TraG [Vallitalea longa]
MKKVIYTLGAIISILIIIVAAYVTGAVTSIEVRDVPIKQHIDEYIKGDVEVQDYIINTDNLVKKLKSPFKTIEQLKYTNKWVMIVELAVIVFLIIKIWIYIYLYKDYIPMYLQMGGKVIDKKNTFGSAKFVDIKDIKEYIKKGLIRLKDGVVLGSINNPNEGRIRNFRNQLITVSENKRMNKHIFVNASSGDGKSSTFVITSVINLLKSKFKYEPSFLFTDPKGELYETLAGYMRKIKGYTVYLFNLVSMKNSDRFNVLDFIEEQKDVSIIVDTILKNTRVDESIKGSGDPFWNEAEQSIIKAIIMYYKFYLKQYVNMPIVFDFINNSTYQEVAKIFEGIPNTETCKQMYNIYNKAPDSLKGNILLGLCSRLSIFIESDVRALTEKTDINILDLKDKKTAIFAVIPDTHSSFNFLAALFETVIGMKVVEYTDRYKKNKMIKNRDIYAFLDECANVGVIPGFKKWITTFRSRNFHLIPIFQDIIQPEEMYGKGWNTIFGNCHTKICLGVGDLETAKFYSQYLGEQSIKVSVKTKQPGITKMFRNERWTQTDQKANLMNPSDLTEMDMDELIVIRRGCKPMKVYKFFWENFKDVKEKIDELSETIFEYIPEWNSVEDEEIKINEKNNQVDGNKKQEEEKIFHLKKTNVNEEKNIKENTIEQKIRNLENGSGLL